MNPSTSNTLICIAMKAEAKPFFEKKNFKVLITGMGKVNTTFELTRYLLQNPEVKFVLNLGTAGSATLPKGTLTEVTAFLDRDVNLSMVGGPKYSFSNQKSLQNVRVQKTKLKPSKCASGDSVEKIENCDDFDIVDMEAFALSYTCERLNIPFLSVKYISDNSDDCTKDQWQSELENAQNALFQFANEYLNFHQ